MRALPKDGDPNLEFLTNYSAGTNEALATCACRAGERRTVSRGGSKGHELPT